jgi:hypothetical protein
MIFLTFLYPVDEYLFICSLLSDENFLVRELMSRVIMSIAFEALLKSNFLKVKKII